MTLPLRRTTVMTLGASIMTLGLLILPGCGGRSDDSIAYVNEPTQGTPSGGGTGGAPAPDSTAGKTPAAAPAAKAEAPADSTPATKVEGWGTLKGRVVFEGNAPEPKVEIEKGKASKDPTVCAVNAPIVSQKLVVNPKNKGVKNAIVYIPQPTAVNKEAESEAKGRTVLFDQKGCVFDPHVLAVMEKSPVTVKSSDPVGHNVNIKLPNNQKNFTVPANGTTVFQTQAAERAPGQVVCDIHTWMTSWWYVSKNPYYAVTDDDGNFEIKNVPAGAQKVVVWAESVHPKLVANKEPVTIKPSGETTAEYKIDSKMINP
jgi:hypothetical protein